MWSSADRQNCGRLLAVVTIGSAKLNGLSLNTSNSFPVLGLSDQELQMLCNLLGVRLQGYGRGVAYNLIPFLGCGEK